MFKGSTLCVSFISGLFVGVHDLSVGGDVYKMALYTNAANLSRETQFYTTDGEAVGGGYAAGGIALANLGLMAGDGVSYTQFESPDFSGAGVTARGALIYNSSKSNSAVVVIDFGADKYVNGVVQMPLFTAESALIRLTV